MDIPVMTSAIEMLNKFALPMHASYQVQKESIYTWLEGFKTDIISKVNAIDNLPHTIPFTTAKSKTTKRRAVVCSSDEDVPISQTDIPQVCDSADSTCAELGKRKASKMASLKINTQSFIKLNTKLRRPDANEKENVDENISYIKPNIATVKIEKKSKPLIETTNDIMRPPAEKPKRGRKKIKKEIVETSDTELEVVGRITRSKRLVVKKEQPEKSAQKISPSATAESVNKPHRETRSNAKTSVDSDVFIQEVPVPLVTILDSEDDEPLLNLRVDNKKPVAEDKILVGEPKLNINNTTVTLETINSSLNVTKVILNSTHILTNESPQLNTLNSTHVIKKVSLEENGMSRNCSVVLHKLDDIISQKGLNNKTMIIDRTTIKSPEVSQKAPKQAQNSPKEALKSPKFTQLSQIPQKPFPLQPCLSSLLTDDDDSIEVQKTPEKKVKKTLKTKPMFSPHADSPVKKRVAAFEKLGTNDNLQTRVTRTKTRNIAAKENQIDPPRGFPKLKFITPLTSNKIPSMIAYTDSKLYRNQHNLTTKTNISTSTDVSVKSSTAIKISRVELLERKEEEQKRRLEKENEAKRKKEQMMIAKTDEQRRKREEKQARAQKTREAMDKEKEEKLRQLIQEKEQKQLEEIQKKKEWEQTKAADLEARKKMEEQVRQHKIKEHEARRKLEEERKARLNVKPPPLPTEDCEDSDSSSENVKPKCLGPFWAQKKQLDPKLLAQRFVPKCYIEKFFQMRAQTPDLREIFDTIDERALRRNSSAIWRTPPRYSTLPKF